MKLAQKILLVLGIVTLAFLLWKLDVGAVWALVAMVKWGFILIIGQEVIAHLLNAYGWHLGYRREDAAAFRFRDLLRYRIIGDGVNYLTPSAQLAGEFARASLLNPVASLEVRLSGVVVAKFAQAVGQGLIGLSGVALCLNGRVERLAPYEPFFQGLLAAALLLMIGLVLYEKLRGRRESAEVLAGDSLMRSVPRQLRRYLADHPGRFMMSILMYAGAYAWGTLEVWMICKFIGLPVGWEMAFAIEALSCIIDGVMFFVPAKVGTQEAGKTAIFVLLGLPAQSGLAFGIVRHVRELAWASAGMALYSIHLKHHPAAADLPPEKTAAPNIGAAV
jgi:uncharacterized membrane protein YbhN (UPF0104 family)